MSAIKIFIYFVLFFTTQIIPTFAQFTEFEGDTIEINLDGYKEGTIRWKFSTDKQNWENLDNANSVKLIHKVIKSGFFKADIQTGNCINTSETYEIKANKIKTRFVLPSETDNSINKWLSPHYVTCNKNINEKPELALYFSGTSGKPSDACFFIDSLAQNASHTISLSYPNTITPWSYCQSSSNICFENFRREVLWGFCDSIIKIQNVDKSNSVYNRLFKLLNFLAKQYPDEGWNYFISNNEEIDWSKIIISGWSQGGGLSLFISKYYSVKRVVMFSAPSDYILSTKTPALWLSKPGKTNNSKIYGFATKTDETIPIDVLMSNWNILQLPGNIEIIEADTKLLDQHKLLIEKGNHGSPNFDSNYFKVWKYLFNSTLTD